MCTHWKSISYMFYGEGNWSSPFRKQFGKINQEPYNGHSLDLAITSGGVYLEEVITNVEKITCTKIIYTGFVKTGEKLENEPPRHFLGR